MDCRECKSGGSWSLVAKLAPAHPQPLQPPPGWAPGHGVGSGPRGATAAGTGAQGGSGSRHGAGRWQLGAVRAGPHALRGAGVTAKTSTSRSVNTARGLGTARLRCRSPPDGDAPSAGMERDEGVSRAGRLKSMGKGSAGHPLWQALPGFLMGWCSQSSSALLPTPQNTRVENGTPHFGKDRGERDLARCSGGSGGAPLSSRARRQAGVPDSGSGKQLAQRGGDGGDATLTRTEHGWPKATLEAELGCLAEPRLAYTLHTTISGGGGSGASVGTPGSCWTGGDPTAPHVTQALTGIGISLWQPFVPVAPVTGISR
ncbi:uncharacterized PE-PGRS family protein PE_PGRS10-like [Pyrgilauda ruficollis]|uniref:uncharacterized PE-PGRS family protein PE_PGRS10-like n=1 Tax=Pyrgilauda ruficollis TaxID=221976 RepID=UPI001B8766DF|nr:uncharacterized PE-PGRS family protein PE_PGRS10-like [Pyrgilauda ruficollis]